MIGALKNNMSLMLGLRGAIKSGDKLVAFFLLYLPITVAILVLLPIFLAKTLFKNWPNLG